MPDLDTRIASLKEKKDKIASRLPLLEQKAKAAQRKRETRQKIIVGGLVLDRMAQDAAFATAIRALIAQGVTRPHDREAVSEFLDEPALP